MIDIEYGEYGENLFSFDNAMVKVWLKEINQEFLSRNIVCISDTFGLMDCLFFEGEALPFSTRNGNFERDSWKNTYRHCLGIKSGKGKVYWNNINVTDVITKRYEEFLSLCKELNSRDSLGKIYGCWNGSKLTKKLKEYRGIKNLKRYIS